MSTHRSLKKRSTALPDAPLHVSQTGDQGGAPLVLLHTLATDHHLWDDVLPHLPDGVCLLCPDLPGHGQTPLGPAPGRIGALIAAVEATLDAHRIRDAALLGHGLGGLVAQGLATKRLDLVRSLILSGTAARIGTRARWLQVATEVRQNPDAFAQSSARNWSLPRANPEHLARIRHLIGQQDPEAIAQAAEAIAGTDFYTTTAALRLPTLALVGDRDAATPSDLVAETAGLIPGSHTIRLKNAGHLAMLDSPINYAKAITEFLKDTAHI